MSIVQARGRGSQGRDVGRAPNRACSWDVTEHRGPAKGIRHDLAAALGIALRLVVGWTLALREGAPPSQ